MLDGNTSMFLDRLKGGDEQARDELFAHAYDRLQVLTRRMLKGYPRLKRWEDTGDVLHNALHRLHQALEQTSPQSAQHFFNLAALEIRRELVDLARHHHGPQGQGAMHHSDGEGVLLDAQADGRDRPTSLAEWTRFHEKVETLPDEEKEVFGLIWYAGRAQDECAEILGISIRTVKRRWQSARLKLVAALGGELPE